MDRRDFLKTTALTVALSSASAEELLGAAASFSLRPGSAVLSNGLCRIVWAKTAEGWVGQAEIQSGGEWYTLGTDGMPGGGAYEVLEQKDDPLFRYADFADKFRPGRVVGHEGLPIEVHRASRRGKSSLK